MRNMVGPTGLIPTDSSIPGKAGELPRWNDPKKYVPNVVDWPANPDTRNDLKSASSV